MDGVPIDSKYERTRRNTAIPTTKPGGCRNIIAAQKVTSCELCHIDRYSVAKRKAVGPRSSSARFGVASPSLTSPFSPSCPSARRVAPRPSPRRSLSWDGGRGERRRRGTPARGSDRDPPSSSRWLPLAVVVVTEPARARRQETRRAVAADASDATRGDEERRRANEAEIGAAAGERAAPRGSSEHASSQLTRARSTHLSLLTRFRRSADSPRSRSTLSFHRHAWTTVN